MVCTFCFLGLLPWLKVLSLSSSSSFFPSSSPFLSLSRAPINNANRSVIFSYSSRLLSSSSLFYSSTTNWCVSFLMFLLLLLLLLWFISLFFVTFSLFSSSFFFAFSLVSFVVDFPPTGMGLLLVDGCVYRWVDGGDFIEIQGWEEYIYLLNTGLLSHFLFTTNVVVVVVLLFSISLSKKNLRLRLRLSLSYSLGVLVFIIII